MVLAEGQEFTDRGYTGQLDLEALGLVHMGARLYDPVLGRFLSPDPFLQADSQQMNPYAYAANNPLTVTDPSGMRNIFGSIGHALGSIGRAIGRAFSSAVKSVEHALKSVLNLKTLMRSVVFRVVADIGVTIAWGGNIGCTIAFDAAMSSASTLMSGGSWRDAIGAGALGAVEGGVGLMGLAKVVSFSVAGTIGGTYAVMVQHASFVSGFVSGATIAGMSPGVGPKLTMTAAGIAEDSLAATENTIAIGVYQDVASHVAQKLHLNVDELDLTLEAVSWLGGSRTISKDHEILGFNNRPGYNKVVGFGLDMVDATLAFQGLPTRTGWEIIMNPSKYQIDSGHSLGSLEAMNLARYGFAVGATVYAVPFGFPGGVNVGRVVLNPGDPIVGFGMGFIFHPLADRSNPSTSCAWPSCSLENAHSTSYTSDGHLQ